jgi:hypothetical protein
MIETCTCNMLCPCWYGVKDLMIMDQGWCASPILWRINEGSCDGVSLNGITFVFAAFFPGPTLFDGNATARLYFDTAASPEQKQVLEAVMQGKKRGPMEVLAPLVAKWLPARTTKIAVEENNGTVTATVGDIGTIRSQRLKNDAGQQMTTQNVGFAMVFGLKNQTAELAPSDGTRWSDPDMPRHWESKSGAAGTFTWNVA